MQKNKIALVTGSTSGIGKAIALKMAELGHQVLINGFGDQKEIDALVDELTSISKIQAHYFATDMSNGEEIKKLFENINKDIGPVNILVNNAGIQHVAPVEEFQRINGTQ